MPVTTDLQFRLSVKETVTRDLGDAKLTHLLELMRGYASGTSINTFDVVYSDSDVVASGTPVTYDVLGALTSLVSGQAISFVDLCGVIVKNKSTTSGRTLNIGGGSNGLAGFWGAAGDLIKIGPGGLFVWWDPADGISPAAGTADILQLAASAGSIEFDLILVGRSA